MKLQADRMEGLNAISRHGAEGVLVNGVEHRHSVIVPWQGTVVPWGVERFEALALLELAARAGIAAQAGHGTDSR